MSQLRTSDSKSQLVRTSSKGSGKPNSLSTGALPSASFVSSSPPPSVAGLVSDARKNKKAPLSSSPPQSWLGNHASRQSGSCITTIHHTSAPSAISDMASSSNAVHLSPSRLHQPSQLSESTIVASGSHVRGGMGRTHSSDSSSEDSDALSPTALSKKRRTTATGITEKKLPLWRRDESKRASTAFERIDVVSQFQGAIAEQKMALDDSATVNSASPSLSLASRKKSARKDSKGTLPIVPSPNKGRHGTTGSLVTGSPPTTSSTTGVFRMTKEVRVASYHHPPRGGTSNAKSNNSTPPTAKDNPTREGTAPTTSSSSTAPSTEDNEAGAEKRVRRKTFLGFEFASKARSDK